MNQDKNLYATKNGRVNMTQSVDDAQPSRRMPWQAPQLLRIGNSAIRNGTNTEVVESVTYTVDGFFVHGAASS